MNTAGLEWFGPPEGNTLCPLCVGLLVFSSSQESPRELGECVCVCLVLCLSVLFFLQSFSNGRLPFIVQGRRVHSRWTPTGGPNEDV